MTSPQREPRRPIPIPRNLRRTSALCMDGDQGALSEGEGPETRRQSYSGAAGSGMGVASGEDEPEGQAGC